MTLCRNVETHACTFERSEKPETSANDPRKTRTHNLPTVRREEKERFKKHEVAR